METTIKKVKTLKLEQLINATFTDKEILEIEEMGYKFKGEGIYFNTIKLSANERIKALRWILETNFNSFVISMLNNNPKIKKVDLSQSRTFQGRKELVNELYLLIK